MRKTTIILLSTAAVGSILLGSCGMNSKSGDAEVRFSHVQAEASYRLVGAATEYVFGPSVEPFVWSAVERRVAVVFVGGGG